jgi:hypothetical protein
LIRDLIDEGQDRLDLFRTLVEVFDGGASGLGCEHAAVRDFEGRRCIF